MDGSIHLLFWHQGRKISMKLLICEVNGDARNFVFGFSPDENADLPEWFIDIQDIQNALPKSRHHLIMPETDAGYTVSLLLKLQLFWAHRHRRNDRVVVLRKSQILRKKNQKNERLNVVIRVE
jgi:hypothetical protein